MTSTPRKSNYENNMEIEEFVKSNHTKVCDTCKKARPTESYVTRPTSMCTPRYTLDSTCRICKEYKKLTGGGYEIHTLQSKTKCWKVDTENLLWCCNLILNYDKENGIKTKPEVVDLKKQLEKVCELMKI